jgi:diguanylate cyclase (GGDEF)-like protein
MSANRVDDCVPLRVLSIEDDALFTEVVRRALEREGFATTIERVQARPTLERALGEHVWDIILSDHKMPGFSSQEALEIVTARGLDLPFILVSGEIGEDAAVAAMRSGAHDYVPKESLGRLGVAVRNALDDSVKRATLRQRERDLEALHAVAFAAGSALDSTRLAQFAAERGRELLGADMAAVYWWNADARMLEQIARSALVPEAGVARVPPGVGMSGVAFERREAIVVDDYLAWPHRLGQPAKASLASAIATPLFVGERAAGAFVVGSFAPRRFGPPEVRVLSVLSAEVAPAIETSHLRAAAWQAANYDGVTGLPNRALFTQRLAAQIDSANDQPFAMLYADLDGFRDINDAFGHDAGDAVLRELGTRLRRFSGIGDSVGRLGTDEFAALLPLGTGLTEGRDAAEQAVAFLGAPFTVDGHPVHVAASYGIVAFPEHGREAGILLQRAELAMFAAKRSQSRYRVYSSELDPQSQKRIALASELRQALSASEFVLHYQPQVDCKTGAVVAVEALVRWNHPQRGLVPPGDFIPFAEQSGLIVEITPLVVREALRQARDWRAAGIDLRVSVNVAMRNLRDPAFLAQIEELVAASGVPPATLILEITEGTIMLEAERTLDLLQHFREMGIGISIDDFGTGYSSLAYLGRLPVDEIKIDRSFVMDLGDPGNRAIVDAVIQLGHAFGLRVVAEGVKDSLTWDAIRARPCDLGQGFFMSPPVPADAFARWLNARSA